MVRLIISVSLIGVLLVTAGCGSSEETDRDWMDSSVDTTSQAEEATFVTRTDTVTTEGSKPKMEPATPYNTAPVRFMVQIGSFRHSKYASAVQALARKRFRLPVVNDYNAALHLYQIRIGFFETKEDALEFLQKLRGEYPGEYRDAWLVQISK